MKRNSITFLQIVLTIIGISVFAFLLWEPHLEGRNLNATFFEIYFKDPFLAYVYVASIPFFIALYQAFKLLSHIRQNKVFSEISIKSLRVIKYCAISIVPFVIGAVIILLLGESDDRPPIIMIGTIFTVISIAVAAASATFEKVLQNAVAIKSDNELTV